MICERCQKKKASVIHREMRGGRMAVRHLCAECTEVLESTGELEDISAALPPYMAPLSEDEGGRFPLFSGKRIPEHTAKGRTQVKCPLCGMNGNDLSAVGRAGCPRCYDTFSDTLSAAICAMNGDTPHKGRVPAAVRERQERGARLATLRERLREAVLAEQYERAATLRDEIRALESNGVA